MRIEADLLGTINENAPPTSPLQRKFLLRVTAEQLNQWLHFERKGKGKNSKFKISAQSTIRIDKDIQRGPDAEGYLLQTPPKIMEIANTLLSPSKQSVTRLYLGTLIWNVRPKPGVDMQDFFDIQKIEVAGKPTQWRLAFDTDAIYLTDSAHRHLGIVEAYKQFSAASDKFPAFDPKIEFSVELYTLNAQREKELFSELNGKQKKISPSKKKEMDVSSPIGVLKDAIQDYDQANDRLFDKNIEVGSRTNDKHTLITMSVFVESISEMFTGKEIKEAREDEELRIDLSSYYCDFFYELASTIVVRADIGNGEKDYHPFRNLYNQYIKQAEDAFDPNSPNASEEKLQVACEIATKENLALRRFDVANHNSFVKVFARLGGYIRQMEKWRDVIARLQTRHVIPSDGKFFQKENKEWFEVDSTLGIPMASLNEDGTINIQVQSKTINAIYAYLIRKLNLNRPPELYFPDANGEFSLTAAGTPIGHKIATNEVSYTTVRCCFYRPKSVTEFVEGTVRLDLDGGDEWRKVTKKGKNGGIAPLSCEIDTQYVDADFNDIVQWHAVFEVPWPAGESLSSESAMVRLKFVYPQFQDPNATEDVIREVLVTKP